MKLRIKYPNLTLLGASILFAIALTYFDVFDTLFSSLGSFGYLGAFVAGILFPITFTSPIAVFAFFYLGGHYSLFAVTGLGAVGALLGDLIIFTFIKDGTLAEIEKIREEHKIAHPIHGHQKRHEALVKLFHSRPFHALALFIGGLLILMPGPDEFGIAIFASYKFNMKKFVPISLILNTASIWLVAMAGANAT
mgnify:CR=1 FL=1